MNMEKIETFLNQYKSTTTFGIIIVAIVFVFSQNLYLSTHLEECRAQNELYKQNPPRIEPGKGGYDNWKSSITVDG